MTRRSLLLLFSVALLFLLAACNGAANNDTNTNNEEDTISSLSTNADSQKYPHTKPVKIQEAKYKFVRIDQAQGNQHFTHQQNITNQTQQQNQQKQTHQRKQQQTQQNQQQQNGATPDQGQAQAQQQAPNEQQQNQQQTEQKNQAQATEGISEIERRVIELTNEQRRENGLPDLQADTSLSNVAREKSKDMRVNNYFSHTSPTYGSPFDMMRDFGITYQSAGENIAQGQRTADEVVQAWMNSEGHRKNILSDKFTHIGVGYDENGHHWTQMFIQK
ncbi:putative YkwD family protein [Salirhabdus euzebyi]|uniref:Putative YkwD family protein n=1 Tax=Salirhabdus euzebyi TaxID=394506 RepID=A0A841Q2X8_9BACI|nr:CAP domain-containing protein [Salirhabdus euzebyi]MBB6451858.1 putative YkwD family protein [Salirhabdus euzebyi]